MRYRVVFTPVGWQVIDTVDAVDPLAEFGTGPVEYERATAKAQCLNMTDEPDAWDCAPADEAKP